MPMTTEEIHVGQWYWAEYTRKGGDEKALYATPAKIMSKDNVSKTVVAEIYFDSGPVKRIWNYDWLNGPVDPADIPKTPEQIFFGILERVFIYGFAAVALYKLFYLEL